MNSDSAEVVQAKRLVDVLKQAGFVFERTAPGVDGPLVGRRMSGRWVDMVRIEGFSRGCHAWRQRRSLVIVPDAAAVDRRISGGAIAVLSEVSTWQTPS